MNTPKSHQNQGDAESPVGTTGGRAAHLWGAVFRRTEQSIERIESELSTADPSRTALLAVELVKLGGKRGGERAWTALGLCLNALPSGLRERVVIEGAGRWGTAAQALAASSSPRERLAAARLCAVVDDADALPELVRLLSDDAQEVRDAACAAVVSQCARVTTGIGVNAATRCGVEATVAEALNVYDAHRRPEIIRAALELLGSPARRRGAAASLQAWLDAPEHVAHMPARALLKRSGADAVPASLAMLFLDVPALSAACLDRLLSLNSRTEADAMLRAAHLLASPARAQAWRKGVAAREKAARDLFADERFIEPQTARSARRVPAVLAAAASEHAWNAAIGLLVDPRPAPRAALVRALRQQDAPADAAVDAAFDAHPSIACSALRSVLCTSARDTIGREQAHRLCEALTRSPHAPVRGLAEWAGPALTPWNVDRTESRVLARRMLRRDPSGFALHLRRRMIEGEASDRTAAIRLAGRLGCLNACEAELLGIVRASRAMLPTPPPDEPAGMLAREQELRVVATATSALAQLDSGAAADVLLSACTHSDARVRANAIDALWRAIRSGRLRDRREHVQSTIVEFKNDPHHRVRASAIRAELLAPGDTPPTFERVRTLVLPMLIDARPMHRIAALWLAERAAAASARADVSAVTGTIADLVSRDPSAEVRRRARRCAERLLASGAAH